MDTVRYAVIGLGFFGEKHAEVLSGMPEIELTAVCTRRPHRLKEVAKRFDVPKMYTNYKELRADDEVDAVSIVTQGVHKPDTFYWPKLLGKRSGVLQNELSYFAECIREGKPPDVIAPEQSREAVAAVCAAERSAHTGEVVKLCQR